jgi:hypothetical protein
MIYFDDSNSSNMNPLSDEDDYMFGILESKDKKKLRNNPYLHDVESLISKLEKLKKEFEAKFHRIIDSHRIDVALSIPPS